jgi:hypothetical protein
VNTGIHRSKNPTAHIVPLRYSVPRPALRMCVCVIVDDSPIGSCHWQQRNSGLVVETSSHQGHDVVERGRYCSDSFVIEPVEFNILFSSVSKKWTHWVLTGPRTAVGGHDHANHPGTSY